MMDYGVLDKEPFASASGPRRAGFNSLMNTNMTANLYKGKVAVFGIHRCALHIGIQVFKEY